MTDITTTTTDTPALTALLLARCAALRNALERAAREAIAGNGHAGSMQALSDDDRMQERIAPLLPKREEVTPADAEMARHVTETGGINR